MPKVFNVLYQPLYLNLPGAQTIKVPSRGTAQLEAQDLDSPTVIFHVSRGNLVVVDRNPA